MVKSSKSVNVQHVLKIVELDDFNIKKTKFAERQPLNHLKITLFFPKASTKDDKQANPIKAHEEDNPTSPKKNCGRPLGSKNKKKNLVANNVVQKCNVLAKKGP